MSNVPEGWGEYRQGDVADFSNGKAYKLTEWEKEGTPVIRLQNLTGSGKEYYYSNLVLPPRQYCESGDLLYMWSATFGPHIWKGPKAIYHYHIWKITCDEVNLTKPYLFQLLGYKTASWLNQSNGMGILHITKGGMEELPLILPPLPEQQKIAAILTSVDDVIEKTQAQIDKLKDLKTGMMQELLTRGVGIDGKPHTEFKDSPVGRIPKGWEVVELSKVVHQIIDCEHKTAPYVEKSDYMVVRTSNVRNGELVFDDMKFTHENGYSEWTKRATPSYGDVLFTREAPAGESCLVPEKLKICMGQRMVLLRPNVILVHPCFFSLFLTSATAMKSIYELSIGTTVNRINIEDIKKIPCVLPSLEEQSQISKMIESTQNSLTTKQYKLKLLTDTKKALMQDLLTGKVRVKVE